MVLAACRIRIRSHKTGRLGYDSGTSGRAVMRLISFSLSRTRGIVSNRSSRRPHRHRAGCPAYRVFAVCVFGVVCSLVCDRDAVGQSISTGDPGAASASVERDSSVGSQIARWIKKLGDRNFVTRQRAKVALQSFGLEALEQLRSAQSHPDIEIAVSAQRLSRSSLLNWSDPADPPEIRALLDGYGSETTNRRETRIGRLAVLNGAVDPTKALTRLARFETESRLSRLAAFKVMGLTDPADDKALLDRAESIRKLTAESTRDACLWLRIFADDLQSKSFDQQRWSKLLSEERSRLNRNTPNSLNSESLLTFVRLLAERAIETGFRDEALALGREHLDLVQPSPKAMADAVTWSLDHDLPELVLELRGLFMRPFSRSSLLIYSAAEASLRLGNAVQAEQYADDAIAVSPIPEQEADRLALPRSELEQRIETHTSIAYDLRQRGFFEWAEREYLYAVERSEITSEKAAQGRYQLASMYSDLRRHQDVIETLAPLIQRISRDDDFAIAMERRELSLSSLRILSGYHLGLLSQEKGDVEAAMEAFEETYEINGGNPLGLTVDVLIAMYRLNGSEEWTSRVKGLVRVAERKLEREVSDMRRAARNGGAFGGGVGVLANRLNGYAWLVGNTEGDYDKALQRSLESLEIFPDQPAYLDTLGRCHFAVGDLESAIGVQRRAVELDPHLPPLQQQLNEFLAAQKAQSDEAAPAAAGTP